MSEDESSVYEQVTLDQLHPGEECFLQGYQGDEEIHLRLKELGLIRGVRIAVKRFAPLGDPMEVMVRGFHLSLRKKDASYLIVKKTNPVESGNHV
ncbi:MAG: ferrous iron transport protein A [Candidatus Omnitrophica bacterium]|nr:ferrous iron transport protein A [Candidatus Omnitrophota bacterium]